MLKLKPFIRVIILSLILTYLLIYLGVRYHWGDQLKPKSKPVVTLPIPNQSKITQNNPIPEKIDTESYSPEIIKSPAGTTLLDSMNKEQITEQCVNLLSKELIDPLTLELATVNCVVSNYQHTFQNIKIDDNKSDVGSKQKMLFSKQCKNQYMQSKQYSIIEKELLIGICVSDRLSN